jgi:hypothetical protein
LTNWTTIIPIGWAICNVKVKSRLNNQDAGYSENNGRVILPLAFLPPNAAEVLGERLVEGGVAAIEVTIEFDRQRHSDEKLVATKNRQAEQERHLGCL